MRNLTAAAVCAVLVISFASPVLAQGMMGRQGVGSETLEPDDHTAREEKEGREVWFKLKSSEVKCPDLKDDDFEALGEYSMGLMIGDTDTHAAMNRMMTLMMGEEGELQMHLVMGKRVSGCDEAAAYPSAGQGFGPMMMSVMGAGMMFGGYAAAPRLGGMMSGFAPLFHWTSIVTILLNWTALVLAIIALLSWISKRKK